MARPLEAPVAAPDARAESARARYDAFISYSHAADGRLAPALQSGLHRFAKPWYRLRALRVFRDEASLSADPALWSSIERALTGSGAFILLASPEAAASPWVDREVAWWRERNGVDRLLIVLTDGEIAWDDEAGEFDRAATDALPPALLSAFTEESRWIDLRWAGSADDVSLRNTRFQSAVADVAAPLHGRPKDELIGEDVRQHRRAVRLARGGVATLLALLLAAVGLAVVALDQRSTALAERDRAEEQARIATSRLLATQAAADLERSLDRALLLGLEAFRLEPTFEARATLVQAVQRVQRVPAILRSHDGEVLGLSFSPDGTRLLSSGDDETVRVWDVGAHRVDGRTLSCFCLTNAQGAAFTPDGARVVSVHGFDASSITIWDAGTRRPLEELEDPAGAVEGLAVSADGRRLASFGEGRPVVLWDLPRTRPLGSLPGTGADGVWSAGFSPDGRLLAVDDAERGLELWDAASRRPLARLVAAGNHTRTFAFSPDGRTIAVAGEDAVRLWSVANRRPGGRALAQFQTVGALAFDPAGRLLAAGTDDGTVHVWEAETGRALGSALTGHEGRVNAVAFGADGGTLASAGQDGTIRLWSAWAQPLGVPVATGRPSALAFDAGGTVLAVGMLEEPTRLLSSPRWEPRALPGDSRSYVLAVATSPDGSLVAVGDLSGEVSVFAAATGERVAGPLGERREEGARELAFSRDGHFLAASGWGGTIRVWRAQGWQLVGEPLRGGEGRLETVTGGLDVVGFLPDGRLVSAGGRDVNLWRIGEGRVLGPERLDVPAFATSAALAPGGTVLALGGDDSRIRLLDLRTRRLAEPLAGHRESVGSLAFDPEGTVLASASALDGTIRLWDTASGRPLAAPLRSDAGNPLDLAFAPDGTALLSAHAAALILWDSILWRGDLDAFVQRLCPVAGRNLTRAEWERFLPGRPYALTCPDETAPASG